MIGPHPAPITKCKELVIEYTTSNETVLRRAENFTLILLANERQKSSGMSRCFQ
jgi:hypothetical protein